MLKSQQHHSLIKANERKVLYIFSFLTFWFFCVKTKEHEKKNFKKENRFIAQGRLASLMQRRCLRFFEKITCGFFNSDFVETELQKAPNA